jgi:hypothetical protein
MSNEAVLKSHESELPCLCLEEEFAADTLLCCIVIFGDTAHKVVAFKQVASSEPQSICFICCRFHVSGKLGPYGLGRNIQNQAFLRIRELTSAREMEELKTSA